MTFLAAKHSCPAKTQETLATTQKHNKKQDCKRKKKWKRL
jgi:hypothetical protein